MILNRLVLCVRGRHDTRLISVEAMGDGHVHAVLHLLLGLVSELRLVAHMLPFVKPLLSHSHC